MLRGLLIRFKLWQAKRLVRAIEMPLKCKALSDSLRTNGQDYEVEKRLLRLWSGEEER